MGLGLWALALAHVPGALVWLGGAVGLVASVNHQAPAAGSEALAVPTTVVPAAMPTTSTSAFPAPGYGAATQSSLPLRWRVAFARYLTTTASNCATSVIVQNVAPTDTDVQVHAITNLGTSVALSSEQTLSPGHQRAFWTNNDVNIDPFRMTVTLLSVGTTFQGHILVHADDPRVLATAYIICRTDDSNSDPNAAIVSTTNVPTFPVGQTLEFFRASVPEVPPGYRGEVLFLETLPEPGLDP